MAEDLGRAVLKLQTDSSGFNKGIEKAETKASRLGNKMKDIGGTLSKSLSLPLAAAGAASLKWASELEESMNAVNVVFKEAAGGIHQFGENAVTQVGLARSEFNQLSATFGSLLQQSGMTMEQASQQTINLTKRAADLASVYDTDVKQAANALGSALRGEVEPARRFSINVGQAAIKSHALATGMIEAGQEMSEAQKVQARLSLLMKQSSEVAGDFQNTSGSLANMMRTLTKDVKDTAAEFGKNLMPTAKSVISVVKDLVSWFGDLSGTSQRLIAVVSALTVAIPPLVAVVGAAIVAFGSMATIITGGVLVAVAALTAAAIAVIENWEPIKGFFADLWGSVKNIFNDFLQWMRNVFIGAWNTYVEIIQGAIDKILSVAGTVGGALGFDVSGIERARDKIAEAAEQLKGVKRTSDDVKESFSGQRSALERVNQKAKEQNDIRKIQHDLVNKVRQQQEKTAEAAKKTTEEMKAQNRISEAYRSKWEKVNENWRDLGESLQFNRDIVDRVAETGKLTAEQKRQELKTIKEELQLNAAMLEQASEFPNTNQARLDLLEQIRDVMEDISGETETQVKNLSDLTRAQMRGMRGLTAEGNVPGATEMQRAPGAQGPRGGGGNNVGMAIDKLVSAGNAFFNFIKNIIMNAKPITNVLDTLVSNISTALGPAINTFANLLIRLSPFMQQVGNILNSILVPVFNTLGQILTALMPVLDIVATILKLLGNLIQTLLPGILAVTDVIIAVLKPVLKVLAVLLSALNPFLQIGITLLQMLMPFIEMTFMPLKALANILIWLHDKIFMPVGNKIMSVFQTVANFFIDIIRGIISAVNKIPWFNINKPGRVDFSGSEIQAIGENGGMGDTTPGGTGGGGGSQIDQARPITVNIDIYDNELAGSDGFRELAQIIRGEFESMEGVNI